MGSSSESICSGPSPADIEIGKWRTLIKKHEVCRMHIKKYKVVKNTDIDKLLHRTNVEKSVFYLTEGKIPKRIPKIRDKYGYELVLDDLPKNEVYKDQSEIDLHKMPAAFAEHSHEIKHEERKHSSLKAKNKYGKSLLNIRDRIFIPVKGEETLKGITDVDEKYFSIAQERYKKSKLSLRKYLGYLRESLRLRLQTGYVYDEIYKLKEQSEIEKNKLNQIRSTLKHYKLAFDEYLAEDHNESMFPLLLYAEEVAETDNKRNILRDKLLEVSKIRYKIYDLEDSWRNSKLCEEFLLSFFSILSGNCSTYYLYLKYGSDYNLSHSEQPENDESLMSLLQFTAPKIVNNYLDINLQDPAYLLEIFKSLEHQCLDYLTFTELLEQPNMSISIHLDLLTKMFDTEIRHYHQNLLTINNIIIFMEQNNANLKTHLNNLLNGLFKETFEGAEESILINEYVKQTFNKCITGSDSYVSTQQMMNSLALEYKNLLLEMDDLPTGLFRNVVKTVEHRENMRLKIAVDARRRLNELQSLTDQMSRIFNPPVFNKGRKLVHRSSPSTKKADKVPSIKEISKEEKQYLLFFTEYCPYTDNPEEFLAQRKK